MTAPQIPTDLDRAGTPGRPGERAVRRTVRLGADVEAVRRALTDPELLSCWLGDWHPLDGDRAVVRTDDGIDRVVEGFTVGVHGVSWRWSPADDPTAASDVVVEIHAERSTDGEGEEGCDGTTLTLVETPRAAGGPVALDGLSWAIALLAMEVVSAAQALSCV